MSRWLPLLLLGACAGPDPVDDLPGTWVSEFRYEYFPECFATVHSRIGLGADGTFQWYWDEVQGLEDGEVRCFYAEPRHVVQTIEGEWQVVDVGQRTMLSVRVQKDRWTIDQLVDPFDPDQGWRPYVEQWDDRDRILERLIRWGAAEDGSDWLWLNQTGMHYRYGDEDPEG